jgi:hypothetical protein
MVEHGLYCLGTQHIVGIEEDDDVAGRRGEAGVEGGCLPAIVGPQQFDPTAVFLENPAGVFRRGIRTPFQG